MKKKTKISEDIKATEMKRAFFHTKSEKMEDGNIKVILTKQIYDRDGEVLDIDGCDLENFLKNPKMLWNHRVWNAEVDDVLGSWKGIQKGLAEDGIKVIEAQPDFTDAHPKANWVKRMVQQGHLNTVSVGYRIVNYNNDENKVVEWELYEASWVPLPANVEAMVVQKGLKPAIDEGLKQFDEDAYKKLLVYEKIKPKIKMFRGLFLGKAMCDMLEYTKTGSELVDIKNIHELLIKKLTPLSEEAPKKELAEQETPVSQETLDPAVIKEISEALSDTRDLLKKYLT